MSNPNYPDGVTEKDIDNIGRPFPLTEEPPPEIENVEYKFFFDSRELEEEIRISGGQISWLGIHVNEIRFMFEFFERNGQVGDEGQNKRLERFVDFIGKEFNFNVKKEVYMSEVQTA